MHRPLANAILETFQPNPAEAHALARFPLAAWTDTYRWIDTSGLALYFLHRIQQLELEASLPAPVLERLQQNFADNRARTADTFAEFIRINRAFTAAGVPFVNVKGISLVPFAFPDPALRLQLDLDFLIEVRDIQTCAVTLADLGYVLTGVSGQVWEFKAGAATMPSASDLYKSKPQRSVEVHFEVGEQPLDLAARRSWTTWDGFTFPALNAPDIFIAQAAHVLKHMRGEWTRLSWLLEFRHSVEHFKGDRAFWQQVRNKAAADTELRAAIGAAILLSTIAFGAFAPEELTSWTVDALDPHMRLWIDRYGREAIMAVYPGTKLYMLQPEIVATSSRTKRRRLIPLHSVPRVIHATDARDSSRLHAYSAQMIFILFRLRFHFTAGLRYMLEAPRWKKILATTPRPRPALFAADKRGAS
jgi:hypothetical protein